MQTVRNELTKHKENYESLEVEDIDNRGRLTIRFAGAEAFFRVKLKPYQDQDETFYLPALELWEVAETTFETNPASSAEPIGEVVTVRKRTENSFDTWKDVSAELLVKSAWEKVRSMARRHHKIDDNGYAGESVLQGTRVTRWAAALGYAAQRHHHRFARFSLRFARFYRRPSW